MSPNHRRVIMCAPESPATRAAMGFSPWKSNSSHPSSSEAASAFWISERFMRPPRPTIGVNDCYSNTDPPAMRLPPTRPLATLEGNGVLTGRPFFAILRASSNPANRSGRDMKQAFRIGSVVVDPPLILAPMAGITDEYFRRILKRIGGVGVV